MDVSLQAIETRGRDALGRLYYRIRGPHHETGRRATLACGRWTPSEAAEELERATARVRLGLGPDSAPKRPSSVDAVCTRYLEEIAVRQGSGDAAFVVAETQRLTWARLHLGALPAAAVTRPVLARYLGQRRADPCRTGRPVARSSLGHELAALQRAFRACRELGVITTEFPPWPSFKGIPDDRRPHRRLTEPELLALLRAAAAEDAGASLLPAAGTWSRELFDLVERCPGITAAEATRRLGWPSGRASSSANAMVRPGVLRAEGERQARRYFVDASPVPSSGLWSLLTVLAWSGRPVAVFALPGRMVNFLRDPPCARTRRG